MNNMQERFLCRGKRKDNKQWIYGAYFCMHHEDERTHIHSFIIPENAPIPKNKPISEIQVEIIPETLGQCTGVKDKNVQLIFEGDIVRYTHKDDGTENTAAVYFSNYEWKLSNTMLPFSIFANTIIEIIGNIHDNPELLVTPNEA